MTLCVGWTDSDAVYLTADSAVTKLGKTRIAGRDYSSFGEKQYQSPQGNVTVEESALKIFRHQDTAAAFAGDASSINDIFANFVQSSRFLPPQEAFDAAWMSSYDSQRDLAALFGYHDITGPHLTKYNSFKVVGDATTSACIGNLTTEDEREIGEFLQRMPTQASVTDRLVSTVCMTQRLGVFSNLMETHGIGGFVAGCSITDNGFRWAPDTLHIILRGDLSDQLSNDILNVVLTCERLDTVFVCNTLMKGGYDGFTNRFGMNFGLGPREVVQNILAKKQCLPPISTELKVDYVVFHDVVTELSTIFNVRAGDHPNLKYWLTRDHPTGPLIVRFTASGNGLGALKRPSSGEGGNIAFVPY